jgi:hypothetical protein
VTQLLPPFAVTGGRRMIWLTALVALVLAAVGVAALVLILIRDA